MEYLSDLSGHWLEIIIAVYLIGMVLYGHYKGFIRLAVSATALLITLVTVNYAQPYVIDWLKNDTPIYESMKENMAESIGIDEMLEEMGLGDSLQKEDEWQIIEELPIPEQMKRLLVENNNIEVYKIMGVEFFRDYVGGYLSDMILKAAVFLVLFLVVFLALQILVTWLDLIAKLPILSGLNKIAGAILGGAQALVFVWIACLIFTMFSGTEFGSAALAQIDASPWLSWIYDHNMLSYLVLGLIRSVW
ncbi:MAG: CvpA family protein [Lachnospiraceae bacterium]|nr:CvpA family protein [Lachnospiraceae bacterium]